ncbi:MAG TPA: hypothetical protein HA237_03700 [Candidatus Diapherotrites archaeon]|uniref:Ni/Fe hydrogenase subunit alpha n=1 Tax=Candidatus Iainarchaeum sp. TaxID=3101447 RepID=A0A7J4IUE4_9ARCH|nr:hypothetical protein [Candidatus Diapherotrites archaeon]
MNKLHQGDFDIIIDPISKIEGHAEVDVRVRKGEVEYVKLKINENKRFYSVAVRGKHFNSIPQLVSRICGTCSIAHLNCSIEAFEKALNVQPSEQTLLLRKLSMYGLNLRDHAMHLYLFCLPDIFGKDSVLDFNEKEHEWVMDAFEVKAAGNALSTLILGRAVHGMFALIGGYAKVPTKEQQKEVVEKLKSARPKVLKLIEIFYQRDFSFKRKTNHVALISKDYSFLEGEIQSTEGICIPEAHYWEHLWRVIIPYSQSVGYQFEGKNYMVGALSRMNMNKAALMPETRRDCAEYLSEFPSDDIYNNNLAQAIEMLHCIDHSIEILETLEFSQEPKVLPEGRETKGVGVLEAPRGTLYYMMELDGSGMISYADIITPSQQNQINMEADFRTMIPPILDKSKEEITFELEKLIRAYDPCFSCASHFLKVNWL